MTYHLSSWLSEAHRALDAAQAEVTALRARVAELEARTAPIPGVTDGSREHEPYTPEEVALIEAQRGKAYSRLRVTVQRMRALATNHQMLLGGDVEEFIALPQKSGIAVLEFRDRCKTAEVTALRAEIQRWEEKHADTMGEWMKAEESEAALRARVAELEETIRRDHPAGFQAVQEAWTQRDEWKAKAEALAQCVASAIGADATTVLALPEKVAMALGMTKAQRDEAAALAERLREALTRARDALVKHEPTTQLGDMHHQRVEAHAAHEALATSAPAWLRERDRALAMRVAEAAVRDFRGDDFYPQQQKEMAAAIVDSCLQENP